MTPSCGRSHAAVDLQRAQHREPGITRFGGAGTLVRVAVGAALRAEPPALFITERPRRQGEQYLLVDERRQIDRGSAVERLAEIAAAELDLPAERHLRPQHQR